MMKATTLAEAREQLSTVLAVAKGTKGFNINQATSIAVKKEIPDLIRAGNEAAAIDRAVDVATGMHNVLAAFFRFAVFEKKTEGGNTFQTPRYIGRLEFFKNERYDTDLVNQFQNKIDEHKQNVQTETNGTFANRMATYNELCELAETIADEQSRRDVARLKKRTEAKKPVNAAEMTNREQLLAERQAQRDKIADDFATIL